MSIAARVDATVDCAPMLPAKGRAPAVGGLPGAGAGSLVAALLRVQRAAGNVAVATLLREQPKATLPPLTSALAVNRCASTGNPGCDCPGEERESPVANQASVQRTPADTSDCTKDQTAAIERGVPLALRMVGRALRLLRGPSEPQVASVKALLRKYFGDDSTGTYMHVRAGFRTINNGIRSGVTYECEQPGSFMYDHFCGGASAYVRHPLVAMNIHMCANTFGDDVWLATVIIHENSHYWDWTDDEQYCTNGCSLDRWDAYDNADSFAMFAREAWLTL